VDARKRFLRRKGIIVLEEKKITFRRRLKLQELPMEKQLAGDKETTEGEEEKN